MNQDRVCTKACIFNSSSGTVEGWEPNTCMHPVKWKTCEDTTERAGERSGERMTFTIPLAPVTKKNSQQIFINHKTGKRFVSQSKQYIQYEKDCCKLITGAYRKKIDYPINLAATFFMPTARRVDLVNLIESLQDILVKVGVLTDDNSKIVVSTDGSRVAIDRKNPRTEVSITPYE